MHNIILTGSNGFIGKAFAKRIGSENLYQVEHSHAFEFLNQYDKWDEVDYHILFLLLLIIVLLL